MRNTSHTRCLQPQINLLFMTKTTEIQRQTMHVQTRPGPYKNQNEPHGRMSFYYLFELADPIAFTSSKRKTQ